jgi:AcrR family transcriptional regulator
MYRQLPRGPQGMERQDVARNQRARLYGAMIEAVARRGYAGTSVAELLALAGVSRRALYELFSNKEDCFLATYDSAVARTRKVMLDGWASERGWANRLHASCKALLDDVASFPKPARLVLVESLAVGPSVRERMQLAGHLFERLVSGAFSSAPNGPDLPRLSSKAIVAGVRHVLFLRLREGREEELSTLADELLDWCESCRSPLVARLGASAVPAAAGSSGPGTIALLTTGEDRARALVSVIYLALDERYDGLTDPQIARFAGISTEAFHQQFESKQAAFLALLDAIAEEALASVRERMDGAGWPESVNLGVSAFVDYLVSHEALTRIAFVEVFSVGPGTVARLTAIADELTRLLTASGPGPRRGPLIARDAVAGALWGIVSSCVLSNRLDQLPRLAEHLSFLVLAPYVGAEAAVESIEAARGRPSQG